MHQIMANITISKDELKRLVKRSVREELDRVVMKRKVLAVSYVSDREQKEIEKKFGKPSRSRERSVDVEI